MLVSELIDVVVMDVEMLRMDGMYFIKCLCDDDLYFLMFIVMFLLLMSDDNCVKVLVFGVNDMLMKFEIGKMVVMMDKYILNM